MSDFAMWIGCGLLALWAVTVTMRLSEECRSNERLTQRVTELNGDVLNLQHERDHAQYRADTLQNRLDACSRHNTDLRDLLQSGTAQPDNVRALPNQRER